MAYDSYKLTQNLSSPTPQNQMLYDKAKQVRYLYDLAMDRVDGCLINNHAFTESPRIFGRKTRSDYLQTITVETINSNDKLHVSDLLQFDGDYWLCVTCFRFHELYYTGTFFRCNYTLLFQLPTDYSIVSVPCITSGKTFDVDESKVINLGANKKSILCVFNSNTATLKADKRLYVDKKNPPTPYKIIGDTDTTSTDGLVYFIVEQDTAENTTQYPDRPDLGICNYHEPVVVPPTPVGSTYSEIKTSGDLLIGSNRARTLTATCYNADKTVNTSAVIVWNFMYPTGFESLFTVTYPTSRTATIKCGSTDDYDKLIGKVVKISVSDGSEGFVGSLDLKIKMN